MSTTESQRDYGKLWIYLEKLFDWAGNHSEPMQPDNLAFLRVQITDDLERLATRAISLESAPMLAELLQTDGDPMRTVVIDMRDGTKRSFQTMVDWLDDSPTLSPADSPELLELRADYRDHVLVAEAQTEQLLVARALAEEAEGRVAALELRLTQEREEFQDAIHDLNQRIERDVAAASGCAVSRVHELEQERDKWKSRWLTASRVVDESLPAIAVILTERTEQLAAASSALREAYDWITDEPDSGSTADYQAALINRLSGVLDNLELADLAQETSS